MAKSNNNLGIWLFAVTFVLHLPASRAENSKGNGGGAHVCQGRAEQESYDLFEGTQRYNLQILTNTSSIKKNIDDAVLKLTRHNRDFGRKVSTQIEYLLSGGLEYKTKIKISDVHDADVLMLGTGCEYVPVAVWDDSINKVFVDNSLFQSFNNQNRAALILHEAIYKIARLEVNEANSNRVRKLVAELMSTRSELTFLASDLELSSVLDWPGSEPVSSVFVNPPGRFTARINANFYLGDDLAQSLLWINSKKNFSPVNNLSFGINTLTAVVPDDMNEKAEFEIEVTLEDLNGSTVSARHSARHVDFVGNQHTYMNTLNLTL